MFADPSHLHMAISGPWRVNWPIRALQEQGYPADLRLPEGHEMTRWVTGGSRPDLIVIPRGVTGEWTRGNDEWVAAMRRAGIALAADFDDDLFRSSEMKDAAIQFARKSRGIDVETASRAYAQFRESNASLVHAFDGCIVSTRAMAELVRQYVRPGRPVLVVPNAIDPEPYVDARRWKKREVPPLTVGWAGSKRMPSVFEATGMAQAWRAIARRYPQVTFVTIGDQPEPLVACVPADRIVSRPFQDFGRYVDELCNVDIACCPLEASPFNVCKSPQKAWELALTGAAVVASPTVYADDPRFAACGGLLAEGPDEWEAQLSRLIENEQERRERVASLERFVLEECSLEVNLWRWPAAWRTIVQHARGSGSRQHSAKRKKNRSR